MNLNDWALQWGVSPQALQDLRIRLGTFNTDPANLKHTDGVLESDSQTRVRLEASRKGKRLWRNNNGACYDQNGNFIRYGLCNESKKMNAKVKSSDLIGIQPVLITPAHVGTVIGQFLSREIKRRDWVYQGTPEEKAQLKFTEIVIALGGDGGFATDEGTLY